MTEDTLALQMTVRGRVQGVFFRETARRWAQQRRIAGWVRNRADGSVEAVFEGQPDAVASMVESCRLGPPDAHVERIDVHEEAPEGLSGFAVR